MAISFTNLGASANPDLDNGATQTSYSNTSWTPPTDGIILVWIQARDEASTVRNPTMSGNSLTWVRILTFDPSAGGNGLSLFIADASGATTGATTVDFGGNNQVHCNMLFFQATGVDISGGVASAVVQQPTTSGSDTTGTVTFSAAGDAANRMCSFFWHQVEETVTGDGDWTDLDSFTGAGQARGMLSQYRGDATDTAVTNTWTTSASYGGVGVELLAEAEAADLNVTLDSTDLDSWLQGVKIG